MAKYPDPLVQLIGFLKKLPGVGSKTAERYAFHLLGWQDGELGPFAHTLKDLKANIQHCSECGCLTSLETCEFCDTRKRDASLLCVIASAKDVYALEETRAFRGFYHVLGGLLSPLDGRAPHHLSLQKLQERITRHLIREVVIALDSTIEGDATSLYLKEQLASFTIKVSRLAFGLPMGSPLEYADGGTLSRALSGRQQF